MLDEFDSIGWVLAVQFAWFRCNLFVRFGLNLVVLMAFPMCVRAC
jgi:hypothetical protein